MPDTTMLVRDNPQKLQYEMVIGDRVAGVITYRLEGEKIVLTHTRVKQDFEGKGVASRLARAVITGLREDGRLQVRVECPYLCHWLGKNPELAEGFELDPQPD